MEPFSRAEERGVVVDLLRKVDGLGTNAIRRADDVNVYIQGSLGGGSVGVWICVSFIGICFRGGVLHLHTID